jgi:predicted phage baseplate assembly protein
MALPAPNLDDRRFQDLVDDAKRLVQRRCPEWTDHNVSDPGVTLIETFAFMVDQLLYRLNRVPERNYLKFLELIGVNLFPPVAAKAPVTFWLSAPSRATVGIPPGTEVATLRTESDEAVVFTTTEQLGIVPCSLGPVRSSMEDGKSHNHNEALESGAGFLCFQSPPRPGDALLVGLTDPVPRCAVVLRFDCQIAGVGVDPRNPPLRWECYDGASWAACEVDHDDTGGFNRAGDVVLHVPPTHAAGVIGKERAGWLRALVTTTEEGQPAYHASPRIHRLRVFSLGGTIPAVHAEAVTGEVLGTSDGTPGQRFSVKRAPVTPAGSNPLVLEVANDSAWSEWLEVEDFAASGPEDRHFRIERLGGEVVLGPALRQPDGCLSQYGMVPPKGATLRMRAYSTGGGSAGNVAHGAICVLRSTIPYISRVENRRAAVGGVDGETVEEAKLRGPMLMRVRNRAVTTADYERLAKEAAPEVARVRCVPVADPGAPDRQASAVRLLVVPAAHGDSRGRLKIEQMVVPPDTLKRIASYLDERRTVGARVVVEPPTYQGITVVARIRASTRARPGRVADAAERALYRYYHPIVGGPDGLGWPFGRPVHSGEVYAVLQRVDGVEYLEEVRLFGADPRDGRRGSAVQRLDLDANSLVFSYDHALRVEQ